MKKFLLSTFALLLLGLGNSVKAQTDAEYEDALATIKAGHVYHVITKVSNTTYYLTTTGYLTANVNKAGRFNFRQSTGKDSPLKTYAWDLGCGFTNPDAENYGAGPFTLNPGHIRTTSDNRNPWERQVFFKNADGKYAVRATNASGSNWGANTFWNVETSDTELPKAGYSLDAAFIWELQEVAVTKTPILLLKNGAINTTDFDITPISPSTLQPDNLYAATFKPNDNLKNTFQYLNFNTGDNQRIVIKFGSSVPSGWCVHTYGGQFDNNVNLGGKTEYVINLTGEPINDFTIFNWGSETNFLDPITINEVYFEQGAVSVKSIDYSNQTSYPYYVMNPPTGSSFNVADGTLVITNTTEQNNYYDLQPFIIDNASVKEGYYYTVRITMKASAAGTATVNLGNWSKSMTKELSFAQSDDNVVYDVELGQSSFSSTNNVHSLFQCGKFIGTVTISKVEVLETAPANPFKPYQSRLQAALTSGRAISSFKKTTDSYATLTNAISAAETALTATEPTEISLTNALNYLNAAIDGIRLEDGFVNLTKAMYHEWTGIEDDATIKGDGGCALNLNIDDGMLYGNTSVKWNQYAKIVDGKNIFICGTAGQSFGARTDRLEVGNGGGDSNGGGLETLYISVGDEGYGSVDISNKTSLRINAIKRGSGSGVVTDLLVEYKPRPVTISAARYATFSADLNTKATGAKAYVAKVEEDKVVLTEVTQIPAGSGVIVKGEPDTYEFPVLDKAEAITDNDLKVSDGNVTGDESTIYVLANGSNGVGFYKLANGDKVPAGKVYLEISSGDAAPRAFIGFDAEATGIETVKAAATETTIYNLTGQRLSRAQKGLNIINGKVVYVK